jgi:peptidylprolyl isomerase
MAREEYNANSASSQVFLLLFESDLTPAGKNLLDGRYSCFGYTIKVSRPMAGGGGSGGSRRSPLLVLQNAEQLAAVKEGDLIASAKVVSGMEHFNKGAT